MDVSVPPCAASQCRSLLHTFRGEPLDRRVVEPLVFSISYLSQHCHRYMSCISIARLPDGLFSTMLQVGVLGERPDLPPDWGHNNEEAIRHGRQMGTLQLDQASVDAAARQGYTTCLPECTQVDAHGRTPVYRFRPGV